MVIAITIGNDRLVIDGILRQLGSGARGQFYEARVVLGALDESTARASALAGR